MSKTTCYSEFIIQSSGKMTENGFISNSNSFFKPEEITEILKITPHRTTTMNEPRPLSGGNYPFSTWCGCKKEEPTLDANIQVHAVVEMLKEKIPLLLQIKKKYDVNFSIVIVPSIYNEEAPYIQFDQEIIDFCFQTHTEIGVHLYIFDKFP